MRLAFRRRLLHPLTVAYTLTTRCNLNCVYCEDFGARRNPQQPAPLPLKQAQRVLTVIRQATDDLLITGGEPLLYPELGELLRYARHELRFHYLTLLTNATLLPERWEVLRHVDRVMVSVDATDPAHWDHTLGSAPGTAQRILATVVEAAARQDTDNFRLVLNCVITPETQARALAVLDFCEEHGLLFSFSPQSANNWPRYELLVSEPYRELVTRLIARKRAGAPVLASMAYLRMVRDFQPYACYPLLVPRVLPAGGLAFPCRPIEREEDDAHGGHEVNLLEAGSWRAALRAAVARYGQPPSTCGSCYQQCYIEASLLQARPLALLAELLRYPAVRHGHLLTYAPG